MPFDVIIADDEYFIRQRLKKIIPWEELDLNFLGEAENGTEVVSLLSRTPADLVLLDIKMPHMGGLETAEYIFQNFPMTKIIILSGYNDFEYARRAIRSSVFDYLLKPVEPDALKASIQTCLETLHEMKQQQHQIQKYYHYEKCTALSEVLSGSLSLENLCAHYPDLKSMHYTLYVGCFLYTETKEAISALISLLRSNGWDCEYFKESDYTYIIQLFYEKAEDMHRLYEIIETFMSAQQVYIFISIGSLFSLYDSWLPCYKRVTHSLNQRYFVRSSKFIFEKEAAGEKKHTADISKIRQHIIYCLNQKNTEDFKNYLDILFQDIAEKRSIEYMHLLISEFFITYDIHYHNRLEFNQNITDFVSALIDEDYILDSLKNTVISYGLLCMDKSESIPSDVSLSKKIIAYIDSNYKNPALSVTQIAEAFNLNPSYLGSVFKKINNQSLLQYITTLRMEASKKLLESNQYKISDIAELVGYSDAFYFSKRFKKTYGYSPKDYSRL